MMGRSKNGDFVERENVMSMPSEDHTSRQLKLSMYSPREIHSSQLLMLTGVAKGSVTTSSSGSSLPLVFFDVPIE